MIGLTSVPRKIREDAEAFSVSPDGSWIAFGARPSKSGQTLYGAGLSGMGDREIWLMSPRGEAPRKLLETSENRFLAGLDWARGEGRFLYMDGDTDSITVFSGELNSSSRIPLSSWTNDGLRQVIWLRDGRVLYLNAGPGYSDSTRSVATASGSWNWPAAGTPDPNY